MNIVWIFIKLCASCIFDLEKGFYIVMFEEICNFFQHKNHIGLISKFIYRIGHLGSQLLIFLKWGSMWQILHVNHDSFALLSILINGIGVPKVFKYCTSTHFNVILLFLYAWHMKKIKTFISFVYFIMLAP